MSEPLLYDPRPLSPPLSQVGESPLWHPKEQVLYWCDIPAATLHRHDPARDSHAQWALDSEIGCCAPLLGGGLLLAQRDGLWCFDPAHGTRERVAAPPYDATQQRFNDGKADPQGRLWVGTIHDRREPAGALYRYADGRFEAMVGQVASSNGLAWSPDARTLYWADTKQHTVWAFDFDAAEGRLAHRREFARFAPRTPQQPLADYGGRPDGAAVDSEGCYWVALFEGARLLRLAPDGSVRREVRLPVQCPTMPCFGGPDLTTLYITTARANRPADELARQPAAGAVLAMRVEVPGLPANFAVV